MIKKVIFDVDNTLLMFDDEYIKAYQEVLEKNNFRATYEDGLDIYKSIGRYEDTRHRYSREELLDFINKDLKKEYTLKLIDDLIVIIGEKWTNNVEPEVIDALEYLSKKYELDVLTNWFTESQRMRLEHTGIAKYFKEIIGSNLADTKPNLESYKYFIKDVLPEECIMIGDRIETDLSGALELGMRGLLYDYKHQYQDSEYETFTNWKQLKDILQEEFIWN